MANIEYVTFGFLHTICVANNVFTVGVVNGGTPPPPNPKGRGSTGGPHHRPKLRVKRKITKCWDKNRGGGKKCPIKLGVIITQITINSIYMYIFKVVISVCVSYHHGKTAGPILPKMCTYRDFIIIIFFIYLYILF